MKNIDSEKSYDHLSSLKKHLVGNQHRQKHQNENCDEILEAFEAKSNYESYINSKKGLKIKLGVKFSFWNFCQCWLPTRCFLRLLKWS